MSLQVNDWTHKPWAANQQWVATKNHGSVWDIADNTPPVDAITIIGDSNQAGSYYRIIYWVRQPQHVSNIYKTYQEVGTHTLLSEDHITASVSAQPDALIHIAPLGGSVYRKDGALSERFVTMLVKE